MTHENLVYLGAAVALLGLMLYALFGGADFGGGVWDLLAKGPRKQAQRDAIARAMGPVWEANHVWLIFVVVVLFTCFPNGYAPLGIVLFMPFHFAIVGIMLRGAAFVFRSHGAHRHEFEGATEATPALKAARKAGTAVAPQPPGAGWGILFGVTSVISPIFLGVAFGVVTQGNIQIDDFGNVRDLGTSTWLSLYPVSCGILALSACSYLAAVYLTVETDGELREDFRERAIFAGTSTAGLSLLVLVVAWYQANGFFWELLSVRSIPVMAGGLFCFAASAWAVFGRHYHLSRIFAAGEIVLLLLGWGVAQQPYLIYPSMTLMQASAPTPTIAFMLLTIPLGGLFLIPSLWLLFKVFKST